MNPEDKDYYKSNDWIVDSSGLIFKIHTCYDSHFSFYNTYGYNKPIKESELMVPKGCIERKATEKEIVDKIFYFLQENGFKWDKKYQVNYFLICLKNAYENSIYKYYPETDRLYIQNLLMWENGWMPQVPLNLLSE